MKTNAIKTLKKKKNGVLPDPLASECRDWQSSLGWVDVEGATAVHCPRDRLTCVDAGPQPGSRTCQGVALGQPGPSFLTCRMGKVTVPTWGRG